VDWSDEVVRLFDSAVDRLNGLWQALPNLNQSHIATIGVVAAVIAAIVAVITLFKPNQTNIVISGPVEPPGPDERVLEQAPEPDEQIKPGIKVVSKDLPHTSKTRLFGRKKELAMLTRAWHNNKQNIVVLTAMVGTGKTALLKTWVDGFNDASKRTPYDKIFQWSFYSQGSAEDKQASADEFIDAALRFFDYQGDPISSAHDKGIELAKLINQQRTLLVLDGLEPLHTPLV